MKIIEFCINSKIKLINIVEDGVRLFLKKMCNIDDDSVYWFMVGFHEIIVNAYLHGNKKNEELLIDVSLWYHEGNIRAAVTDRGNGFELSDIPDPTKPENILKSSGRGLLFAKKTCDSISIKKGSKGFTVLLTKKVKGVENA